MSQSHDRQLDTAGTKRNIRAMIQNHLRIGESEVRSIENLVPQCHHLVQNSVKELKELDSILECSMLKDHGPEFVELSKGLASFSHSIRESTETMKEFEKRGEEIDDEDEESLLSRSVANEIEEVERQFTEIAQRVKANNQFVVDSDDYVRQILSILREKESDEDEEIEQFDTPTSIPKCPITQLPIKDPVKNSFCGHSYSREGAINYIEVTLQRKGKPRCPVIGCGNKAKFGTQYLVDDIELKNVIERLTNQGS